MFRIGGKWSHQTMPKLCSRVEMLSWQDQGLGGAHKPLLVALVSCWFILNKVHPWHSKHLSSIACFLVPFFILICCLRCLIICLKLIVFSKRTDWALWTISIIQSSLFYRMTGTLSLLDLKLAFDLLDVNESKFEGIEICIWFFNSSFFNI